MRVVLASHAVQGPVLRVGSHHYARELSRRRIDVLHLSTPWARGQGFRRAGTAGRRALAAGGPWRDEHGTVHVVPTCTVPARWGGGTSAALAATRRAGFDRPDVVLVDQPLLAPYAARLRARTLVYRPTDMHTGRLMVDRERWLVQHADGIVATSGPVLDALAPVPAGTPSTVIENGVEIDRFLSPGGGPRSGIVYVGAVDGRFDWTVVGALAEAFPDEPVTIAGPVTAPPPPVMPSSVTVLGPVPYERVPALLAGARVGVIPTSDDPRNAGRSPMKFYEYLSAGLDVVARRTPSLAERSTPGLHLYDGSDDAVRCTADALAAPARTADAVREVVGPQDWSVKAATLLDFVTEVIHERAGQA